MLNKSIRFSKFRSSSFRGAIVSSGVVAFAGLGDALLYPVLPIYGKEMGFSVFVIGLLLSVNRFVRIIANTPIANIVAKFGMRKVLIICSGLAVITTIFYGIEWGLASFFIARILWGLSYSGLKIASLNYAAQVKNASGLAFGISRSINSLGALFTLLFCPMLITSVGVKNGFFTVAAISLVGVILAFSLPSLNTGLPTDRVKTYKTFYPDPVNLLVFILSVGIDGILVVALSYLLMDKYSSTDQLLAFVAFYLLLKRLFLFCLSLISGILTLKIQVIKLFNFSIVACFLGTLLIAFNYITAGILLAFLFNAIVVTFSPLVAIQLQKGRQNSLQAISSVSTWWDLGAATGAFVGIFLVEKLGSQNLFFILSFLIVILFITFFNKYIFQNGKADRAAL
ncbi:MAG: MFS transporter [Chitinophagales bacterium]|nr:MFS transporter [Chitinophagales bacterium]